MGIESYLLSSSIVGIMAQRLVKRICDNCKTSYRASDIEKDLLKVQEDEWTLYRGNGCNSCNNTGYRGRIAIHEIMPVTRDIRSLVNKDGGIDDIRDKAVENGMVTLKENCKQLVLQGTTSIEELLRVSYTLE